MSVLPMLATIQERAAWLAFFFYFLNVVVPIIPAVIIYWLFPGGKDKAPAAKSEHELHGGHREKPTPREEESESSVEGTFHGWTIKAAGAWGAYVTAFLLGFWAIKSTALPLIKQVGGASVWEFDADFMFTDENNKEISDTLDKLQVEPPLVQPWGKHATITVFSKTLDPPERINLKMDGYDPTIVRELAKYAKNGKIAPGPVTLKRLPPPKASGPAPTPLPAGEGPPALTANR